MSDIKGQCLVLDPLTLWHLPYSHVRELALESSGKKFCLLENFIIKGFRAAGPWSTWTPSSSKRFVSDCGRHLQWLGRGFRGRKFLFGCCSTTVDDYFGI